MGGLAGSAEKNSHIIGSRASGNVSGGGDDRGDHMGGLVGHASDSRITDSSASGHVSDGGDERDPVCIQYRYSGCLFGQTGDSMGALVGFMEEVQLTSSRASGNVFDGGSGIDHMGGLVGYANTNSQITGSRAGGNVSGGRRGSDRMGGLVGWLSSSQLTSSRASGHVAYGEGGFDHMGGLVGYVDANSQITGSSASGDVFGGGLGIDYLGGLAGSAYTSQITGSMASGNVSDGGASVDIMGGLIGALGYGIVRDSLSAASVCDGAGASCVPEGSIDGIGVLIGSIYGADADGGSEVYNCLATGLTRGHSVDRIGFLGVIQNGSQTQMDTYIANNRFDTSASMVTAKAGKAPSGVTIATLSGITGAGTSATQSATAYNNTWLAGRWLFMADSYPRLLYFDFDPDDDAQTDNTIDACEAIASNNNMMDEEDADMPDCGDVLDAWPRPTALADAVFQAVPSDLDLTENADGSAAAVAIGSPVTAYDTNFDAITYSLKAGAPAHYTINRVTGQLSYTGSGEDFETTQSRSLTVIASSIGADGSMTQVEQLVTIRIVDMDIEFNPVPSDLELMENADGSVTAILIGSPITAQIDSADSLNNLTYSLKAGSPAGYEIDSTTGQLSYTGSGENYQIARVRSITVIASATGADTSVTEAEQEIAIRILDVP